MKKKPTYEELERNVKVINQQFEEVVR